MISGTVKIGWENIPPRITARNAINPPQHMAQQLGFPDDVIFSTVYYNGQPVMPFTLLLHFSEILGHVVWAWSIAAAAFFLIKHQKVNTLTYLE